MEKASLGHICILTNYYTLAQGKRSSKSWKSNRKFIKPPGFLSIPGRGRAGGGGKERRRGPLGSFRRDSCGFLRRGGMGAGFPADGLCRWRGGKRGPLSRLLPRRHSLPRKRELRAFSRRRFHVRKLRMFQRLRLPPPRRPVLRLLLLRLRRRDWSDRPHGSDRPDWPHRPRRFRHGRTRPHRPHGRDRPPLEPLALPERLAPPARPALLPPTPCPN